MMSISPNRALFLKNKKMKLWKYSNTLYGVNVGSFLLLNLFQKREMYILKDLFVNKIQAYF